MMLALSPNGRRYLGTTLHALATGLYMVGGAFAFMFFLELLKAREILFFQSDLFFAFRGAGEVVILSVGFIVAGKVVNLASRKIYPRLHSGLWRNRD